MKQPEMACMLLIAAAVIGAIAYTFHNATLETFGNNGRKLRFNGSYPIAPFMCLAGKRKIPCTEFSAA